MAGFGEKSNAERLTIHERLRKILDRAIEIIDFSIICGRRSKEDQEKAFTEGATTKHWPDSKHNVLNPSDLSRAVDIYPYPRPVWTEDCVSMFKSGNRKEILRSMRDWARWYYLAGVIKGIAHEQGVAIRQGCDWDSDEDFTDQTFDDIPHHELSE